MSLSPKPRFAALPAMLFAVGLGLAMWHGHALWRMPVPASPVDLEPSVDLNLALDDHRTGSAPATGAALEARRERIRQEPLAEIARDDAHAAR